MCAEGGGGGGGGREDALVPGAPLRSASTDHPLNLGNHSVNVRSPNRKVENKYACLMLGDIYR